MASFSIASTTLAQTILSATDVVFERLCNQRSTREERLLDAVEHAADVLIDKEQHDAVQYLIGRLDSLDGDYDLEDDSEDCCRAYDDCGSSIAPCARGSIDPQFDSDLESSCPTHVLDQREWTGRSEQQ